jgi:hypothetical protein
MQEKMQKEMKKTSRTRKKKSQPLGKNQIKSRRSKWRRKILERKRLKRKRKIIIRICIEI